MAQNDIIVMDFTSSYPNLESHYVAIYDDKYTWSDVFEAEVKAYNETGIILINYCTINNDKLLPLYVINDYIIPALNKVGRQDYSKHIEEVILKDREVTDDGKIEIDTDDYATLWAAMINIGNPKLNMIVDIKMENPHIIGGFGCIKI
jgi:hypothetical protein